MHEFTCFGIDEVSPVVAVMAGGLEFSEAGDNHAGSVFVSQFSRHSAAYLECGSEVPMLLGLVAAFHFWLRRM